MYVFHVADAYWSELNPAGQEDIDTLVYTRYGQILVAHLADGSCSLVMVQDVLVAYGGLRHDHSVDETCHFAHMYIYDMTCSKWIPFSEGRFPSLPSGRLSHAAVRRVRSGQPDEMVVVGGFRGVTLNDVLVR